MQGQSIFQLLTPLIYLLFAGGFFAIYLTNRQYRSASVLAFAYLMNVFAFSFDLMRDIVPGTYASMVTNIFFLMAVTASVIGMWLKADRRPPYKLVGSVVALHFSGLMVFLFVVPDVFWRTVYVNCLLGAVFAISLPAVIRPNMGTLDKIVAAIFVGATAQFYVRPALVFWLAGTEMDLATYMQSPFYIALHFTAAVMALAIATTLLLSYALRIVAELQTQSQTDPLTDCLNRRGIENRVEFLKDACRRGNKPMAVIVADIDHFKSVNDRFGHAAGDEVIRRLGNMFTDAAGLVHVAGRLGGEEFILVMSDTDLDGGRAKAEELRRAFARQEFVLGGTTESLSMSLGVATLDPAGSLTEAMHRADRALYASKAQGRDCVTDEVQASIKDLRSLDGFTKRNAAALLSNSA